MRFSTCGGRLAYRDPGRSVLFGMTIDNKHITQRTISRMNQKKEETGQARNGVLGILIVVGGLWLLWVQPWWESNRAAITEVLGTARVVVWWAALAVVLVWVGFVVWGVRCWWVGRETPPVVARLSQNCWLSNTSENRLVEVFNYGSEAFFR